MLISYSGWKAISRAISKRNTVRECKKSNPQQIQNDFLLTSGSDSKLIYYVDMSTSQFVFEISYNAFPWFLILSSELSSHIRLISYYCGILMVFRYWNLPIATVVTYSFLCQWNVLYERYRSLWWGRKKYVSCRTQLKKTSYYNPPPLRFMV
jgi:hypothetical protein